MIIDSMKLDSQSGFSTVLRSHWQHGPADDILVKQFYFFTLPSEAWHACQLPLFENWK